MKNLIQRFKLLPISTKRLMSLGIVIALVIALPLFIWGIMNLTFDIRKRAATGEPSICIAENKVITVTDAWGTDGGTCHDIQAAIDAVDGGGYTILINRGDYNVASTINITGKSNLTITGNSNQNIDETWISFNITDGGGWGFKVTNSSGSINWLHAEGITPNGLFSIQNTNNFSVNHTYLYGTNSHTFDVQNSSEVEIADSEIKSSAGAVEIEQSSNINVTNNKIHNSSTAISVNNSSYVTIIGNLITANSDGGIHLWNVDHNGIYHNTIIYNTGSSPTVDISGTNPSPNVFSQNIVAFNTGAGIVKEANTDNFSTISYNDVFDNYPLYGYDYAGMTNPTGLNGNISTDPLINTDPAFNFCLYSDSPAIYGTGQNDYMGFRGSCGFPKPTNTNPPICTQSSIPPSTGNAPLTVTLHGSGSASSGTGFDGYRWDFENDGTWDTGIEANAITHTYTQAGTYHPTYQIHGTNDVWSSVCDYPYPIVVGQSSISGDANGDGFVNMADLIIVVNHYGDTVMQGDSINGNLNSDEVVNMVDLTIVISNYNI